MNLITGEGSKWVHNVKVKIPKNTKTNRTVLSFPTANIWLPVPVWEKSQNHRNGHQKTNNFLCRLLTSCFCVWRPNGAAMISRAFAWQSSRQTLLVSSIQTGSSTIATVNCFSLLLRQSQATHAVWRPYKTRIVYFRKIICETCLHFAEKTGSDWYRPSRFHLDHTHAADVRCFTVCVSLIQFMQRCFSVLLF